MFEKLFSPYKIKNLTLENRIIMPGLASFLIGDDGYVTDKTVEHYRKRAAGGPAMVIIEAHAVAPEGVVSRHQARLYDDSFIEGLSRIAQVMKSEGAIPAIQIHHCGRQTPARVINRKPLAPSPLPCPTIKGEVEPLTLEAIEQIVIQFGDAAQRAVQAGMEMVEIHGAHGYLINQFLSRFSNIREDGYGGDIDRRARFAVEIVEEVRSRVGKDFPLSFKISAEEHVPNGLEVDESILLLERIIEADVDAIQVSAGNDASPEWISQPMFMKKACLADSAARIKVAFPHMPILAVGRINDPYVAESILTENKADFVCIGRGLLADPEMPKKAKAGQVDDIRTCIACNTCMQSIFRKGRIECLVNPTLGREKELEIHPTDAPKKVMVVGAGPGGLNVAWVAAKRGHDVVLYEKQPNLGGQLILGSITTYKKEILSLIGFQKKQAEKFGVTVRLNREVTPELIKEEEPDVIILSTGSTPIMPDVPGIRKPIVLPLPQVLNGTAPDLRRTVIIGGGDTGCEVAHHLAENNCSVVLVEQLPKLAPNLEAVTRRVLLRELKRLGVDMRPGHRLIRVEDNGVWIADEEGNETFIEAERVVVSIGNKPDNALHDQITAMGLGIPIYQIGDCFEPRGAKQAISDGAVIGRTI